MSPSDPFTFAQLCDALSRGRLAPAEIAAIPPRELDALYELAAQCLDAGRDAEAVDLLGGLVTLFPFSARYWRAYAVALHRRLQLVRARAAYDAALALEPLHPLCRCYRAEIWIYLGRTDDARRELEGLRSSADRRAAERAGELLDRLQLLATWRAPEPEAEVDAEVSAAADQPRFTLADARPLPLSESRFQESDEPVREETTQTARLFVAPVPLPLEPTERSITETAVVRRRADTEPVGLAPEVTGTDTALVPSAARRGRDAAGPAAGNAADTAAAEVADVAPPGADSPEERTHTAVVLRRAGLSLLDDEESVEATERIPRVRPRPPGDGG